MIDILDGIQCSIVGSQQSPNDLVDKVVVLHLAKVAASADADAVDATVDVVLLLIMTLYD